MNKKTSNKENVWDTEDLDKTIEHKTGPKYDNVPGAIEPPESKKIPTKEIKTVKASRPEPLNNVEPLYDLEGLMTDFPTAKELEKFVFDQTGFVLNLKGRSNKFKYQTAMDVLNGSTPDDYLLGTENPYLDKNELIPTEELKPTPQPDPGIATAGPVVNKFDTNLFPHPDPDWKAQDQNCTVQFKKYGNGMITYEILGPIAQRAIGERINKYGRNVPERYTWVDPRTGERIIRRQDGSYTPLGTRLRAFMRRQRMNNSNQWDVWIDRDFVVAEQFVDDSPWSVA